MNSVTFDSLSQKLKNAPQEVLDLVAGYVDELTETSQKPYSLSAAQQNILDSQINTDPKTYQDSEKLYADLKVKHAL